MQSRAAANFASMTAATISMLVLNLCFSLLAKILPYVGWLHHLSIAGLARGHVAPLALYWLVDQPGNPLMMLLAFAFAAQMGTSYLAPVERELGSVRFVCWLVAGGACAEVLFLVLSLPCSLISARFASAPMAGLWPLLLLAMTRSSLKSPKDAKVSVFGLFQFPTRWYPCALIAVLSLMSGYPQLDLVVAWLVGVGVHQAEANTSLHPAVSFFRLPLEKVLPSRATVSALESDIAVGCGHKLGGSGASFDGGRRLRLFWTGLAKRVVDVLPAALRQRYVSSGAATLDDGTTLGNSIM